MDGLKSCSETWVHLELFLKPLPLDLPGKPMKTETPGFPAQKVSQEISGKEWKIII